MATNDIEYSCPRVFVSSTCADLADARAALKSLLSGLGFEVLLSEDFPVHPLDHPHDSAFRQVDRSDIFVLIVRRRFGTTHYKAEEFSITQLEYFRAVRESKPVFAYIAQDLLSAVTTYERNPSADFSHLVDDIRVLKWVSALSKAVSRKPFNTVQDIIDDLRQQIQALLGYSLRVASAVHPPAPDTATSWIEHGSALGKRGMYQLALFCYQQALNIDPNNLDAMEWKLVCLKTCGNFREAEQLARAILADHPYSLKTMWNLQHTLMRLDKIDESIKIGEMIHSISDKDYRVWTDLGEAYEMRGISNNVRADFERAEQCFDRAVVLNPESHRSREGAFRIKVRLGPNSASDESV